MGNGRVAYSTIANTAGIHLNPLVTSLFDTYSGMKGSDTLSYPELLVLLTDLSKLATSPEACTQGTIVGGGCLYVVKMTEHHSDIRMYIHIVYHQPYVQSTYTNLHNQCCLERLTSMGMDTCVQVTS